MTPRPQRLPADVMTVGKTSVAWAGNKPVVTFPIPGVPTATASKTNLAAMAQRAGIEHSVTVRELKDFQTEATGALKQPGLRFVVCKIEESLKHRDITRSNVDLLETKYRFVRYLEKTESKPIFLGRG